MHTNVHTYIYKYISCNTTSPQKPSKNLKFHLQYRNQPSNLWHYGKNFATYMHTCIHTKPVPFGGFENGLKPIGNPICAVNCDQEGRKEGRGRGEPIIRNCPTKNHFAKDFPTYKCFSKLKFLDEHFLGNGGFSGKIPCKAIQVFSGKRECRIPKVKRRN